MKMSKLLSIIIPSYNMERYLRKCLSSICVADARLFDLLDIIVVNDGSTDSTSAIAHEFENRYPSVFRVIDKPNGHYGSCVNCGLAASTGRYVKILDADDSFDTENFARFLTDLQALSQNKQPTDLVLSDSVFVNENDIVQESFSYPLSSKKELQVEEITSLPTLPAMPAFTYRRAIFEGLNYHQSEGIAYTDTEWLFLPMTRVNRAHYLPYPVYRYLKGRADQSTSLTASIRQVEMMRQTFESKVSEYNLNHATWSPHAQRYAARALAAESGGLYLLYLQCGCWRCRNELSSLDHLIASKLTNLKSRIGEEIYLSVGNRLRILYVKLCVNHPILRPFFSFALRLKRLLG